MSKYLQPLEVVNLADAAYSIYTNDQETQKKLKRLLVGRVTLPECKEDNKGSPFISGVSGGIFVKKESGFGFCGHRALSNKDDVVVCLRGTDSFHDVLTDAYFKTSPSSAGKAVHGGFNRCFKSMVDAIDGFLTEHPPKGAIHCVGHSLGGALATLAADHIQRKYDANVYLYTLGSPRAGTESFATSFTTALKPENIFRLQHTADPVTAVPIWPFLHVPVKNPGILMDRFGFGFQFSAHKGKQYAISVQGKTWQTLRSEAAAIASSDQIERWLESKKPASFTGKAMLMLSEAIYFVLKKIGLSHLVSAATNTVATVGYTLLDMLALALSKGIKLAESLSKWVKYLVIKMMQMLGKPIKKKEEFDKEAISVLLKDMHRRVQSEVNKALDGAKQ